VGALGLDLVRHEGRPGFGRSRLVGQRP
jgi:hypothetical protein